MLTILLLIDCTSDLICPQFEEKKNPHSLLAFTSALIASDSCVTLQIKNHNYIVNCRVAFLLLYFSSNPAALLILMLFPCQGPRTFGGGGNAGSNLSNAASSSRSRDSYQQRRREDRVERTESRQDGNYRELVRTQNIIQNHKKKKLLK